MRETWHFLPFKYVRQNVLQHWDNVDVYPGVNFEEV